MSWVKEMMAKDWDEYWAALKPASTKSDSERDSDMNKELLIIRGLLREWEFVMQQLEKEQGTMTHDMVTKAHTQALVELGNLVARLVDTECK